MRQLIIAVSVWSLCLTGGLALSAEHKLEALNEGPPADSLSPEIVQALAPSGVKVLRGRRTVCDLWVCQALTGKAGFEPSSAVIYPFEVGQLIGVIRYKGKGSDFRGQEIGPGVYVIRYGQQPVDGNHVGTSDTRDFLLLTPADGDKGISPVDQKELFKLSAKVAGGKHPTMLCLVRPTPEHDGSPILRHDEEHDLWIAQVYDQAAAGESPQSLALVVVGQSEH